MDHQVGLIRTGNLFCIPQLSFFSSPKHFTGWVCKYLLWRWGIWVFMTLSWGRTKLSPSIWALLLTTPGINENRTSSISQGRWRTTAYGLLVSSSMWERLIPHLYCSLHGCHQTPQPADFRCFPMDCCRYHSGQLNSNLNVSIQKKEDDSSYLR